MRPLHALILALALAAAACGSPGDGSECAELAYIDPGSVLRPQEEAECLAELSR